MRFTANFILLMLFIPLVVIGLISATFKYRLLDFNFWQATFNKHNIYSELSQKLKTQAINQVVSGGGRPSDAKVLTDLITPENVKDFLDKNLQAIINYANGKSSQILTYIPITKIPKSLLPQNLKGITEDIPLSELLSKFNIPITNTQIQWISIFGKSVNYFMYLSFAMALVFLVLMIVLTEKGKRLIFPGIAILVTGLVIFYLVKIVYGFAVEPISTGIIDELLNFWLWLATIFIIMGGVMFLIRK